MKGFPLTNNDFPNWFEYNRQNFTVLTKEKEITVLQVGVYTGDCTEYLLNNHHIKYIVDVDTWEGSMEHPNMNIRFNEVEEMYDKKFSNDNRVVKMKMTSDQYFVNHAPAERFDFIYIDGAHTSTQVLLDGINSFSLLKNGGVLAFDDYEWPEYQGTLNHPKTGIDCWLKLFEGLFELLINNNQIWVRKLRDIS